MKRATCLGASAAKSAANASGSTARKPSPTGPTLLAAAGILSLRSATLSPTSGSKAATKTRALTPACVPTSLMIMAVADQHTRTCLVEHADPAALALDRKKLAAFSAAAGRFLRFPIGYRRGTRDRSRLSAANCGCIQTQVCVHARLLGLGRALRALAGARTHSVSGGPITHLWGGRSGII